MHAHPGWSTRDYIVRPARRGGYMVVHRRYGPEVSATLDGRVCLVTYESANEALTALDATYKTPPPA